MHIVRNIFLQPRLFWVFGTVVFAFVLSFLLPWFFIPAQVLLVFAIAAFGYDVYLLFKQKELLTCNRVVPLNMSLGDENKIQIQLKNLTKETLIVEVIDDVPVQFEKRDTIFTSKIEGGGEKTIDYLLRPTERGKYQFYNVNTFVVGKLGLLSRRDVFKEAIEVAVYPSFLQLKKYSLKALTNSRTEGVKKLRRLGHSYEFEQIKNYVPGDDYRSINWKASSRKGELMINQYEDERSQNVYIMIDKSRSMKLPFNDLSLLDYSINAGLVLSNIVLQKHDRAGLITFSDKIDTLLKAENMPKQLHKIMESLYHEKENSLEANYELLYNATRKTLDGRSMLVLFTNFESMYAMERVLPILRKLNRLHLLLVVFFENTELETFQSLQAENLLEVYEHTMAQRLIVEKKQIVNELNNHGIQAILSKPEELTINTINKYLELKSKGMI